MMQNKPFFERFRRWAPPAVGLAVASLYALLQAVSSFRDPDSFYHAGMVRLTGLFGSVTEFPWLPATVLADSFADHHFLYHLLCLPAVWLFGPLVGLKVMTVALGVAAVLVFAGVTQRLGQRYCWAFALLLATSADLMFRLNLAKASSLALILLLLAFLVSLHGRRLASFLLGWAHVWAHGSWPLQPLVALTVAVSATMIRRYRPAESTDVSLSQLWQACGLSFLGTVAGLVVNPFFPANLKFYWHQTVQVALVGLPETVGVGVEWLPYGLTGLIRQNGIVFVLSLVLLGLWLGRRLVGRSSVHPSGPARSVGLVPLVAAGTIGLVLLLLTLGSRRHVEFMVPFALLFLALAYGRFLSGTDLRQLLSSMFGGRRRLAAAVSAYVLLVICLLPVRDTALVYRSFRQGDRSWDQFSVAAEWMRSNLPDDSLILNTDWSDFPGLFYHYPEGRYIIGLDAGFLYLKDPALYDDWRRVASGAAGTETSEIMTDSFDARYLLARMDQEVLLQAVELDSGLTVIYQDDEVRLFTLR